VRWLPLAVPGIPGQEAWPVAVLGAGPPLLLLHGFDSSLLEFRRLAPLLAQDHQLWIPDLCGFGFGPRPPGVAYGPPLVIAQLQALLAAMPAGPVGLIGASMGGAVAVVLAREVLKQQPVVLACTYTLPVASGCCAHGLNFPKKRSNIVSKEA
jgi:pimeloyl-ACP methyl ester carboxylesterase